MSTSMKEHLVTVHKRLSKHHAAVSGHYLDMADCMGKADNGDESTKAKGSLEALAGEHSDMAQFHEDCAAKCSKAAADELNKLVPSNVSAVVPNAPGIRAIPRPGQPPISEKPNVPLEFEKIFSISDDE
jgi:hypothetical protein